MEKNRKEKLEKEQKEKEKLEKEQKFQQEQLEKKFSEDNKKLEILKNLETLKNEMAQQEQLETKKIKEFKKEQLKQIAQKEQLKNEKLETLKKQIAQQEQLKKEELETLKNEMEEQEKLETKIEKEKLEKNNQTDLKKFIYKIDDKTYETNIPLGYTSNKKMHEYYKSEESLKKNELKSQAETNLKSFQQLFNPEDRKKNLTIEEIKKIINDEHVLEKIEDISANDFHSAIQNLEETHKRLNSEASKKAYHDSLIEKGKEWVKESIPKEYIHPRRIQLF